MSLAEIDWEPGAERIEEAYRQRARRLAARVETQPESPGVPALICLVANEYYAIELQHLAEVLPFQRPTPVPGSDPQYLGVINLRGEVRAVLDVAVARGLSGNQSGDRGFILMLRRPHQGIGLRVDGIEELRELRPEELARTTEPGAADAGKLLTSFARRTGPNRAGRKP